MKKWEYLLVEEESASDLIRRCQDYGSEGWELVTVTKTTRETLSAFFKREIPKPISLPEMVKEALDRR